MINYAIVIEIPDEIKKQIKNLCFGPSQIVWTPEECLYYVLHFIGNISDTQINDLSEALEPVFIPHLSLSLQNMKCKLLKKAGVIGLDSLPDSALSKLSDQIERILKNLKLNQIEKRHFPILMGYFENLNPERLNDYLTANSDVTFPAFEVGGVHLVSIRSTGKNTIYESIGYYQARISADGED